VAALDALFRSCNNSATTRQATTTMMGEPTPTPTKKRSLTRTDEPIECKDCEVPSTDVAKLPKNVQRRVRALKKLQLEEIGVLSDYYKALHGLEAKYEQKCNGIRKKRRAIVNGQREPNDDECDEPLLHYATPEELKQLESEAPEADAKVKGIPDFWLTVLMNSVDFDVFECDVPLLKHLTDIVCEPHSDPAGFTISFHFSDNEYFTNTALKKSYELSMVPDVEQPFDFDGSVLVSVNNETINWRDGKDLTKLNDESFFNLFDPLFNGVKITDDIDKEEADALIDDFEIGEMLRQKLIPRAVLYYTDEVDQSDSSSDRSDSSDSGGSDDSEETSSSDDDDDDMMEN